MVVAADIVVSDHVNCTDIDTSIVHMMPHPLAYAYKVSRNTSDLKATMKTYCSNILQVKKQSDELSRGLFVSEHNKQQPSSKTKSLQKMSAALRNKISHLEWLEKKDKLYRSSFQVARCLWQLERTMVETYVAWQQWKRSKTCADCENCSCKDNCCASHTEFLQVLRREEDKSQAKYEQCGCDQARLSTEIAGHLDVLDSTTTIRSVSTSTSTSKSTPTPTCDDSMIRYTLRHYRHCSGCSYFFNMKDLDIFGRFLTCSNEDNGNGDKNLSDGSFYCLECYKRIQDQQDEEETTRATVCIGKTTTVSSHSSADDSDCDSSLEQNKPLMCNNTIINAATGSKQSKPKTNTGRKRRKKRRTGRKKKNMSQEPSLLLSKLSSSSRSSSSSLSECSTAVIEAEKRDEELTSTSVIASNREGNNISIRENCPDTTTTIPATCNNSTAATDGIHNPAENSNPAGANDVNDDANELWLEYLWKTGSMIALNRYMDEMEDTVGGDDDI